MQAIAVLGGSLQMYLGQPDTTPRLDNVHRFMAGVYLSTGLLNFWAASTIRHQGMLVVIAVAHAATHRHASRAVTAA